MSKRTDSPRGLIAINRPEVRELLAKLNAIVQPEGCTVTIQLTPPTTDSARQPIYNVVQVADMIGKSPPTVRAWCNDGRLAAQKIGGAWYISRAALEAIGLE